MTLDEAKKKYKIDSTKLHELTQEDVDVLIRGATDDYPLEPDLTTNLEVENDTLLC